jgi:hypothetical protein
MNKKGRKVAMKKTILSAIAIMMLISLSLTGCGNDHNNPPPTIVTGIVSNSALDGDILVPFDGSPAIVRQGMTPTIQSVFAGIDPISLDEYRAFLDFPLTGPNGVPGNAFIISATLDIMIDSITSLSGTIPIRIDLVSFPQPLIAGDFSRQTLATTSIALPNSSAVVNPNHVSVDVTSLMVQAQNRGLLDFQIRILLGNAASGLIEIDDTTGATRSDDAPFLQVEYF